MNMRASELMIGNIVSINGKPYKVNQVAKRRIGYCPISNSNKEYAKISEIEPIPITQSFLLENGFKLNEKLHIMTSELFYFLEIDDFKIDVQNCSNTIGRDWWVHIDNADCCTIASADVQYVHQLQNIFNIANVEIDIRL